MWKTLLLGVEKPIGRNVFQEKVDKMSYLCIPMFGEITNIST